MARLSIDDLDELRRAADAVVTQNAALDTSRDAALRSARAAEEESHRLVAALRRRAGQSRAALEACDADDPGRSLLRARLQAAEQRLQQGEALAREVSRRVDDLHRYAAAQAQRQHRLVERLTSVHRAVTDDIGRAQGILAQHSAATRSRPTDPARSWPPRATTPAGRNVGRTGTKLVPLAEVETEIEHIHGPEDFAKMPMADMRVALNLLEARVQPAAAAGATRDDLAALDQARGLTGATVTHAGVYDLFFGSDRIRLGRGADGTYSITNGAHRIWLARQMGITDLPADLGGQP